MVTSCECLHAIASYVGVKSLSSKFWLQCLHRIIEAYYNSYFSCRKDCNIDEKSLISIVDELFAKKLIFHNRDFSEIVSDVDILTSK
jgi:hypothetical protein